MSAFALVLCFGVHAFADDKDFAQLDQNKDGVWSRRECDGSVEAVRRFLSADHDGDLRITAAEFQQKNATNKNPAWLALQKLDANKDNVIDKAEYTPPNADKAAQTAAESEFARFDRDENGKLDIAEFIQTPKSGLSTELRFRWLDANEDGRLELGELVSIYGPKYHQYARVEFWAVNRIGAKDISLEQYKKREAKPARTYQEEFWVRDANDDSALQLPEFAVWDLGSPKPTTKQLFSIFDVDADEKLTVEEFAAVPGVRPDNERIVADPIQEVIQQTRRDLLSALGDAKERETKDWPTDKVATVLRDGSLATVAAWDLNSDGKITDDEVERGLRIGFGLEAPADPALKLRRVDGFVVALDYFESLDADHDEKLGKDEFIARYYQKKEENAKVFAVMDANQDGFADLAEVLKGTWFWNNSLGEFQRIDGDFNGRLSAEELATRSYDWHKTLAQHYLPAFDDDGDGGLSYAEFRRTPPANRLVNWWAALQDKNADGKLTFAEFHPPATGKPVLWTGMLRRFLFHRFDRNRNGTLELSEHPFQINPALASAETIFQVRDKDGDGQIDWKEFTTGEPVERHPALRQLFVCFDANTDQHLSLEEFRALPGYIRPELRIVSDPILAERDRFLATLQKLLANADKNKDGEWFSAEWPKPEQFAPLLTDAAIEFKAWDFDANGQVTAKELQRGADSAFGIVDPYEGRYPWRFPDGRIFYGLHWQTNDPNRDGKLTRDEFLPRFTAKPEDSTKRFEETDADKDGMLTPVEVFPSNLFIRDVPADFLNLDKNRDGRVDSEELANHVESWRKRHAERLLPQFDQDGDGKLSLAEFRQTPLGNPVHSWPVPTDRNGNGKLEFSEFAADRTHYGSLWLYGMSKLFFDRLDRDHNGTLEYSEYPFQFDLKTASAELVFQPRDTNKDGKIDWSEFSANEPEARQPIVRQLFAVFDADADQALSLAEFQALPGYVRPELRIVPDPVREERDKFLASLTETLRKLDQNQDHQWSQKEWPEPKVLTPIVGDASAVAFSIWDFDGDGSVIEEEIQRGADFAYGMIDPYEARYPWRFQDGVIVNATYWTGLDKNKDRKLSREEFLVRFPTNPADGEKQFLQIDRDQDGFLSMAELFSGRWLVADSVAEFLRFDADRDGRVNQTEISANLESWRKKLESFLLPQFDIDGDGLLSLREYRQSLLGDRTLDWLTAQTDLNGDGRLDFGEFFSARKTLSPLWMLRQSRFVFDRLDRNHDGQLDSSEFPFQINWAAAGPKLVFQKRDKNQDGKIDWDELSANEPAERHPVLRQLIAVFDVDGDQVFSPDEFAALPGYFNPTARVVPDPVQEVREQFLNRLTQVLKKSDANQDDVWSTQEWPKSTELTPILGDASLAEFKLWDFDADAKVTVVEVQRGTDLAFGFVDPIEGRLSWRFPHGALFYGLHWQTHDANRDMKLSREEFVNRYSPNKEENAKRFDQFDTDKDGILNLPEVLASHLFERDAAADFMNLDKNRDGRVDAAELSANTESWQKTQIINALPQFDDDGDGKLSLREYRLLPLGNPVHSWGNSLDQNGNEKLEPHELFADRAKSGPLWLAGLTKVFFDRWDRDHNGVLDESEYPFQINLALASAETVFRKRDKNNNGKIDWDELSANEPPARHPALRQLIAVFDTDGDQAFSKDEFLSLAGYFNPALRSVPDPLVADRDELLRELKLLFENADRNQDGNWTADEWPAAKQLADILHDSTITDHTLWDFNKDDIVSARELRRGADLLFGLIDPLEGRYPWHLTDGRVFAVGAWAGLDKNNDKQVTREEFLAGYYLKTDESPKRFQQIDRNNDGIASLEELFTSSYFLQDPVGDFLRFDADLNGRLTEAELRAKIEDWRKPLSERVFPQFDTDNDGQLTLAEYRRTPLANPVFNWAGTVYDVDGDGKVTFSEFFPERSAYGPLWLARLARMLFDRSDLNHNGVLESSEYSFRFNPAVARAEAVFRFRDSNRDGKVDWSELSANEPETRLPAVRQLFAVYDADGDQRLSLNEFKALPGYFRPDVRVVPDPLRAERDRLLADLKPILKRSDVEQDGKWSRREWPKPNELLPVLRDSAVTDFKVWDFDGDGSITQAEIERGADSAFGLMDPIEGKWLFHHPDGRVFNGVHWLTNDANHDRQVSRAEFMERFSTNKEASAKLFEELDVDKDGIASATEVFSSNIFFSDVTAYFLVFDTDKDGHITSEELSEKVESWRKRLANHVFPQFDIDGDGKLTLAEYRMIPLGNPVHSWAGSTSDHNGDGKLEFGEFYAERTDFGPLWLHQVSRYYFDRLDTNHDDVLDDSEFDFVGASDPKLAEEGWGPDPIRQRYTELAAKTPEWMKLADQNKNGRLSLSEWPLREIVNELGVEPLSQFSAWDANSDGNVTPDELDQTLRFALGLSSRNWPNGWLRWGNGQIVNMAEFHRLDTDQNGRIAKKEFLERSYAKPEDREKWFADTDSNKDSELTLQEMIVGRRLFISPWDAFQRLDTNKDRFISEGELTQNTAVWEKPTAAKSFPAFDTDADGKLSMVEFLWTPLANPLVAWAAKPADTNNDGYLSIAELAPKPKSESAAWLSLFGKEMFQRWDRDHDGKLSLAEYDFSVDMSRLPAEVAFQIRDKNHDGSLTPEELFSDPKPNAKDSAATMAYHRRKMKAEETFLAADKNADRKLDEQEYQRYEIALREPRKETKTAAAAGEKSSATNPIILPRAGRTWQNWDEWLAYGLTGANLVLAAVGVGYWMRKQNNRDPKH